jgi:hypothetical protein
MKLICAPKGYKFKGKGDALDVVLYSRADRPTRGSLGAAIRDEITAWNLNPTPRAWDFLSFALAVIAADLAGHRTGSPDGWTRELELDVAVADTAFWSSQRQLIQQLLGFLTTDVWKVTFIGGGYCPKPPRRPFLPSEECVSLISGGLDSFIGNLDLVASGKRPFAVSQVVVGDAEKQRAFAKMMGGGLRHLQMNHNARVPEPETPSSQRARSLIFITYGVFAATTLKQYHDGGIVTLYVCENGFISISEASAREPRILSSLDSCTDCSPKPDSASAWRIRINSRRRERCYRNVRIKRLCLFMRPKQPVAVDTSYMAIRTVAVACRASSAAQHSAPPA